MTFHELTKLEVAAEQVTASLILTATGHDGLPRHLLVSAAEELIAGVAAHRGVTLPENKERIIRPEHLADFRRLMRAPANFSKHADKDPDAAYSGPSLEALTFGDDFQTVANMIHLRHLGERLPPHFVFYAYTMMTIYPNYLKPGAFEVMTEQLGLGKVAIPHLSRGQYQEMLRNGLKDHGVLPS